MIETNIRVVAGGGGLELPIRVMRVTVTGHRDNPEEFACSVIRGQQRLAAVVRPRARGEILVLTDRAVPRTVRKETEWEMTMEDTSAQLVLRAGDADAGFVVPGLLERALGLTIEQRGERWSLDSNRIWHEPQPWDTVEGVAAYRRIAFSGLALDGIGFGVAADVHTAYFTADPLSWFFATGLNAPEARGREQLFQRLADRQHGKGTLVYRVATNTSKCYFHQARPGFTIDSPCDILVRGRTYPSVAAYFGTRYPGVPLVKNEPAIFVSFEGIKQPVPVPARFVHLRIFNDALPDRLQGSSAIIPPERKRYIDAFWKEVGAHPFGHAAPSLADSYWRPNGAGQVWKIPSPKLLFGKGGTLEPVNGHAHAYYKQRLDLLDTHGCYKVPTTVGRTLVCGYDQRAPDVAPIRELATTVARNLHRWLGLQFSVQLLPFKDAEDCQGKMEKFKAVAGPMLCIIDREDEAYFDVSLRLGGYRPKRVTYPTLTWHYRLLTEGQRRGSGPADHKAGRRKWDSFTQLTSLDVLQQIEGVPWVCETVPHEGLIVIDVSHERRHYGISLLVSRASSSGVNFAFTTEVKPKADVKRDAINATVLKKEIVDLVRRRRGDAQPLRSLLVVKDGKLHAEELQGILDAEPELKSSGGLEANATLEIVELHKDTLKELRMWDANGQTIGNVEEGSAVQISARELLLANTGSNTLHQGTAEPVLLVARKVQDLKAAAVTCHHASQLNWSNPRVAQRLPLPLSRTDDDLIERALRETRHLK